MNKPFQINPGVLAPATVNAIKEVLIDFHTHETPWIPCGLSTRINWGPTVQSPSKFISSSNLTRIIDHSIDDLTITVEAGLKLTELQALLAKHHQWLSVDWPWGSEPSSNPSSAGTIGGLVARGLSGGLRQRHMAMKDQIIGIGIIRSDGVSAHAGGRVVKNVAGYDLMRLLCGSWGSLALINELTLRTQPIRPARARLDIEGDLISLEGFRRDLLRTNLTPEYCDWIGSTPQGWELQIGLASVNEKAVKDQLASLQNLANQHKVSIRQELWRGPLIEEKALSISLDKNNWLSRMSLPPSNIHSLLSSQELQDLAQWEIRIGAGLGVGDCWQSISNPETDPSPAEQVKCLRQKVQDLGGQLTLLNQPKETAKKLPSWLDSPSKPIIEAVKYQFDPKGQLSIGRLPGVAG